MRLFKSISTSLAFGIVLAAATNARADLLVNQFAAVFGTVDVNASDLKQFTLDDGIITLTLDDSVSGMTIDPLTFDLTGYAGPLGAANPIGVVGDALTIRLGSTIAQYDVVSAALTQLLNSPIAIGFIEMELTLDSSNLAVGGENVIVPTTLEGSFSLNGLRVTVVQEGGQPCGHVQSGTAASASLTAIPEPGTCTLLGVGLMFVGLVARRRKA